MRSPVQVSFSYKVRCVDETITHIAHIVTPWSHHHGEASTSHEALVLAAAHWHAYEERKAATTGDTSHGQ